jgi:thymidylate synthase
LIADWGIFMDAYLQIVDRILTTGWKKENRTGVLAYTIAGAIFEHDMKEGYPLLTTKKIPFRLIASELEFFIRGLTDKKWLQDQNNHIWDEWANPQKVPYGNDAQSKQNMFHERDLGAVYGFQWRHFGAEYKGYDVDYTGKGVDQLANVVNTLKKDPINRRMIVSAWNPLDLDKMGLPACHYSYQVTVTDGKLNLLWNQRSVDTMLGLPFNIASYGLLLHLLAKESGLEEGKLVGFLADVHIYENHVMGAHEQLLRDRRSLPHIVTDNFQTIFSWQYGQSRVEGYYPHPKIDLKVAV